MAEKVLLKEDIGESSTPLKVKEMEADNMKRKGSDWYKTDDSPNAKCFKTSEVDTPGVKNEDAVKEETKVTDTITNPKRTVKRITRPSHRVPWKQFAVMTYNKPIFDFLRSARNRKKKYNKRKNENKYLCRRCECKNKLKKLKETLNSDEFASKISELTREQKIYIDKLALEMCKHLHGGKFTMEEKLMSLSIYKKSLSVYEYLSTILIVPTIKTLKKVVRAVYFDAGITTKMMKRMKEVAKRKSVTDKVVVLMFGKVSLKLHINYNEEFDKILGYEDWGSIRTNKFADHALLFIIRGLDCEWTLPVAYAFYSENPKLSRLVKMYKDVVAAVHEAGFKIVASVCDQGEVNEAALEKLRTNTLRKRGPDNENNGGTILVNGVEIVPLFNLPDLLTDFRNNLVSKDLEFCVDSNERPLKWDTERELHIKKNKQKLIASWSHIELAYCIDLAINQSKRKMPKLTDKIIYEKYLEKAEIECVLSVFDGNVAENLYLMSQEPGMFDELYVPPEGYYTSYIVSFFKKLYDAMNGEKKENDPSYELTILFTQDSFHHEFLETAKKELRRMRFIDRGIQKPVRGRIPCLENLIKTVEGFQTLWKKVNKLDFEFLKTRDFNLEHLDNFSNKNTDLTCQKFARNFRNFCYLDINV